MGVRGVNSGLVAYSNNGEAAKWHLIHIGAAVSLCEQETAALRFLLLLLVQKNFIFKIRLQSLRSTL